MRISVCQLFKTFLIFSIISSIVNQLHSQSIAESDLKILQESGLVQYESHSGFPVFHSKDLAEASENHVYRITVAYQYFSNLMGAKPEIALAVLSPEDHLSLAGSFQKLPSNIIMIADPKEPTALMYENEFSQLPPNLLGDLPKIYGKEDGKLNLDGYFHLLPLHQLAHNFHAESKNAWLNEVFANVLLYIYIKLGSSHLMPLYDTFSEYIISHSNASYLKYRTLEQYNQSFRSSAPVNFTWYQCKFQQMAKTLVEESGDGVLYGLKDFIAKNPMRIPPDYLTPKLKQEVDPIFERLIKEW